MLKVITAGLGFSGSTATNHLLKELRSVREVGDELRFLADPDGAYSVFNTLNNHRTPLTMDLAAKRYIRLFGLLSNRYTSPYPGRNLHNQFGAAFGEITEEYLRKILMYQYVGHWTGIDRFSRRFLRNRSGFSLIEKYFFPRTFIHGLVEAEEFSTLTSEFIDELCSQYAENILILDEGYASVLGDDLFQLIRGAKMLVSIRDPRDIFIDAKIKKAGFIPSNSVDFVDWFKTFAPVFSNQNESVKVVRFENLVLDYEKTKSDIFNWLGVSERDHVQACALFNPENSKKNVGLWKNWHQMEDVIYIEKNLRQFCFSEEK
jgi:hypothetical protein